jgi:hypothetical protein
MLITPSYPSITVSSASPRCSRTLLLFASPSVQILTSIADTATGIQLEMLEDRKEDRIYRGPRID